MAYVDGFLLPVPKRKIKAYLEYRARPVRSGRSTERSSIASVSVTT